jgi:hypothetical protein
MSAIGSFLFPLRAEGTLLTKLNYYDTEVVIPESETLMEVFCPAKRDSMLPEPFTMLSSEGLKSAGSSMTTSTVKTWSSDGVVLLNRRKQGSMLGP